MKPRLEYIFLPNTTIEEINSRAAEGFEVINSEFSKFGEGSNEVSITVLMEREVGSEKRAGFLQEEAIRHMENSKR